MAAVVFVRRCLVCLVSCDPFDLSFDLLSLFLTQRSLYEVRERPSKAYSWKAFMIANVLVEMPYNIIMGFLTWICFYYPIAGVGQPAERQILVMLLTVVLFLYAGTYAHMTIAALPDANTAGALVGFGMMLCMMFSGVLQTPSALPGFWIFMYRVSPFTYWIAGVSTTMAAGNAITCSSIEVSVLTPPLGQTCGEYFSAYMAGTGAYGTLQNPNDTVDCRYCAVATADTSLAASGIFYEDRWRNFCIMWAYVMFNIFIAVGTYWLFRVRPIQRARVAKGAKA